MKMNKNMAMLIVGAVVLFVVYWFFFRKKTTESGYMTWLGLPSEESSVVGTPCSVGVVCGRNEICQKGRCVYSSGQHW